MKTLYVRKNLQEWKGCLEVQTTLHCDTVSTPEVTRGSIGFLEVFESIEALHFAYPDSGYVLIQCCK